MNNPNSIQIKCSEYAGRLGFNRFMYDPGYIEIYVAKTRQSSQNSNNKFEMHKWNAFFLVCFVLFFFSNVVRWGVGLEGTQPSSHATQILEK